MRLPGLNLQDAEQRLDEAEANMVELTHSLHRVEAKLDKILTALYDVNGLDRPADL